jgi:microcystin degradation protein MlrC
MDFSGSLTGENPRIKQLSSELVNSMIVSPHHTRVAAIVFSSTSQAQVAFHFKKHDTKEAVVADINDTPFLGGMTDTGALFYYH